MSKIGEMFKEKKNQKNREAWKEGKKTIVSVRLPEFTIFCLDKLISEAGGNRTANCTEMISQGITEGLSAIGFSFEVLQKEFFAQQGQGFFVDGIKLTAEESQEFMKNPDKFTDKVHHMTPEEEAAYIAEGPHSQEEADAWEKEKIV
jgi:hypothetical protein